MPPKTPPFEPVDVPNLTHFTELDADGKIVMWQDDTLGFIERPELVSSLEQDIFNVTDVAYGALGDGATNDVAAIAAAIAACSAAGGGIVFIPSGTYRIGVAVSGGALLTVPSNVHVRGAGKGATIIESGSTTAGHSPIVVVGTNSSVCDLSIRATGDTGSSKGILLDAAIQCLVRDVAISNDFGWGVLVSDNSSANAIERVSVDGTTTSHCIELNGSQFNSVIACVLRNAGIGGGGSGSNGIEIYDTLAYRAHGNRLIGNYITTPGGYGIITAGARATVIADNVIESPGSGGISLVVSAYDAALVSEATITGNQITAANAAAVGPSGAIELIASVGSIVQGNRVRGTSGATAGIYAFTTRNTIVGNFLRLCGGAGIELNTAADYTPVIGNDIVDCSGASVGGYNGITVGANHCSVIGNTITDTRGGSARMAYGIQNNGASNSLLGNKGAGNVTAFLLDAGTSTTRLGNEATASTGWATFTNLSSDKTCDANATTVDELADILGTLIELLKTGMLPSA